MDKKIAADEEYDSRKDEICIVEMQQQMKFSGMYQQNLESRIQSLTFCNSGRKSK